MEHLKKLFQFPEPLSKTYPLIWLLPFVLFVSADLLSKKVVTDHLQFYLSPTQQQKYLDRLPGGHGKNKAMHEGPQKIDLLGENGGLVKFHLVFNDRFAFSLGPRTPLVGFFISFFAVIFLFIYRAHNPSLGHRYAWLIIFSGAVGNLIDKMFVKSLATREWVFSLLPIKGHVTGVVDFIQCAWFNFDSLNFFPLSFLSWEYWPSFNIADSLVTCGIILLLATMRFHDLEGESEEEK